jgi:hypothetical protein
MKRQGTAIASETETAETGGEKSNASESALNAFTGQEIRWPIVRLAGEWGVSEPTLYRILVGAGLDGAKGFEIVAAAKLTVAHFRDKAEATGRKADEAATRIKEANADTAELNAASAARKLVSMDEARRLFESVWVTVREKVRLMSHLEIEDRNAICELMANAHPTLDENGD